MKHIEQNFESRQDSGSKSQSRLFIYSLYLKKNGGWGQCPQAVEFPGPCIEPIPQG